MQKLPSLSGALILSMLILRPSATATQTTQTPPLTPDIPAKFEPPPGTADYTKRVVMIPMRDGVKLYTVIVVPKGASRAPILSTRTPYNAAGRAERNQSSVRLQADLAKSG